jgi:hypothetical protein
MNKIISKWDIQMIEYHSDFEEIWSIKSIRIDIEKIVSSTKERFIMLLNSVIIFRLNTLND